MLKEQARDEEYRLITENQEMSSTIQELNSNLQIASRFNMANDNTIRRTQQCIDIYEDLLNTLHNELPPVSKMTPLLREVTDFEDIKVASSLKRQATDMKSRVRQVLKRLEEVGNQCWMLESTFDFLCDLFQVPHLDRTNPDPQELKRKIGSVVNDSKSRIVSLEADKQVLRNALETERKHVIDLKEKVASRLVSTADMGVQHVSDLRDKATNTFVFSTPSQRPSHIAANLPQLMIPPTDVESPPVLQSPPPSVEEHVQESSTDFGLCVKALAKSQDSALKLPSLASGYGTNGTNPFGGNGRVPYPIAIHTRSRTEALLARKKEKDQKKVFVKSFL